MAQQTDTVKRCTGCGRLSTQPLGLNRNGEPYLACCPDNNYVGITVVERLEEKLKTYLSWSSFLEEDFEQAKQMEKEQMINFGNDLIAQNDNTYTGVPNLAEQYFNETYK